MKSSGRIIRNLYAIFTYPFWMLGGKKAPDNHLYKRNRIKKIKAEYSCISFIETGTYYGLMVSAMKNNFKKILSIEVHEPLYNLNKTQFSKNSNIEIFLGDSSYILKDAICKAEGRIIFWLDGHYSGEAAGRGDEICPIMKELEIIKATDRNDHCILIDDLRLFSNEKEYPTLETLKTKLLEINVNYTISIDGDCIMALPVNK